MGGLTPLSWASSPFPRGLCLLSPNSPLADGLGTGPACLPLATLVCPELYPGLGNLALCSPDLGHSSLAFVLLPWPPTRLDPALLLAWVPSTVSFLAVSFTLWGCLPCGGQCHLSQALFRSGLTSDCSLSQHQLQPLTRTLVLCGNGERPFLEGQDTEGLELRDSKEPPN